MKKIFSILALVTTLAACKTKVNTAGNKNMILIDTTGLSKNNTLLNVGDNKFVVVEKPVEPVYTAPVKRASTTTKNNNNSSNTVYSSGTSTTTNASYPQARDKGWSHAAKATAIGGGSGAILGAVLNKNNRVGGAIVGSVIGAGTGYMIGRSKDRKTGRVARAKARKNGY
ncbi:MAG: YMGG-like glycine zipper-containing protein [Ferruginibacter sp.]